jgi:hypothetical protein
VVTVAEERTFRCANGHLLDETVGNSNPRLPCPACGSTGRQVALGLEMRVGIAARLAEIKAGQRLGRPFYHLIDRLDKATRTGRLMHKFRLIDKHADHYEESVVDAESGVEIHHRSEPLSQHRGHGSAKRPAREDPS